MVCQPGGAGLFVVFGAVALMCATALGAIEFPAGGNAVGCPTDSWLLTDTEKIIWREALQADAGSAETLYGALLARARGMAPKMAYVRRAGYGIRPAVNATVWCHRTDRGSAIVVVDPDKPDEGGREIFSTEDGFIFDIHPAFDGQTLLMTYKEDVNQSFHLWEIRTDGTGLRQVTEGPYHDVTPLYYPDGRIVFASTRCEQHAMCQDFLAFTLHVCDPNGGDIRRIAFDTLCSVSPGLLRDGTIASSRWEYVDKTLWTWQGLWTVQPDARMLRLFYGQTLNQPEALYAPRQIPDRHELIYLMVGHYGAPIGDLAIVDRRKGIENPQASRKLTDATRIGFVGNAGENWRVTRSGGPGSQGQAYTDPWPFCRELSLASYGGDSSGRAAVVLVDHGGLTYPLHSDPDGGAFSPVSLAPRPKGHVLPGQAPQEDGFGTFFVQDVYQGLLERGVERGQVKGLRVWRQVPKKYNTEGPRIHDHYPLIGWGTYYVKELYGTVPIDEEGSVLFRVPANQELYFSVVDHEGREIRRMGTVTQIPPGATLGCMGCHEHRDQAPRASSRVARIQSKPPADLVPPPWVSNPEPGKGYPIDYVLQVQPIWDRHCIDCHHPKNPRGGIDLSGDKSRFFNMSYECLVVRNSGLGYSHDTKYVDYYFHGYGPGGEFPALKTGSMVSQLIALLREGHSDVRLSAEELETVAIWIDANVPYYGTWEMSRPRTSGGRDVFETPRTGNWSDRTLAPGRDELRPSEWVETVQRVLQETGIEWSWDLSDMLNLTRPEYSRVLMRHLCRDEGGWAEPNDALFKSKTVDNYQRLLSAIREGSWDLHRTPRMDMPGARPIPQPRDFGRVFD